MTNLSIQFSDGERFNLPDISYDKFTELIFKSGASDMEYDKYLRDNHMVELRSFNHEATKNSVLIYTDEDGRVVKFKCIYDSDNI